MWDHEFEQLLRQHLPFLAEEDRLPADASLTDYGLDSLGIVALLISLEQGYGVEFVEDALTREVFETPGSLWRTLATLRQITV